ncbi:hypothetical protein [Angustibacter aerolatus]|nr:hypothetical protein [Angustibacter aerolatus]
MPSRRALAWRAAAAVFLVLALVVGAETARLVARDLRAAPEREWAESDMPPAVFFYLVNGLVGLVGLGVLLGAAYFCWQWSKRPPRSATLPGAGWCEQSAGSGTWRWWSGRFWTLYEHTGTGPPTDPPVRR